MKFFDGEKFLENSSYFHCDGRKICKLKNVCGEEHWFDISIKIRILFNQAVRTLSGPKMPCLNWHLFVFAHTHTHAHERQRVFFINKSDRPSCVSNVLQTSRALPSSTGFHLTRNFLRELHMCSFDWRRLSCMLQNFPFLCHCRCHRQYQLH